MNLPNDGYTAIIRQRGDAEAAIYLADECRKRDAALAEERERSKELLEAARGAVDHMHRVRSESCYCIQGMCRMCTLRDAIAKYECGGKVD